jgi:ABC-type sugar transport system substrate-binding protein
MGKQIRWIAALTLVLVGLVIAGCGSSNDDTTAAGGATESTEEQPAGGGSDGIEEAKAFVAEHEDPANLEYPEPPKGAFDPGTGKVGIITCSTLGTGCLEMAKQAQKAAKAAGWEPSEIVDGKFTPAIQSAAIEKFVQEGVDGIILGAIDLGTIEGALGAAESADIPVVCVSCNPTGKFKGTGPVPMATVQGSEAGEYLGNFVVANSEPGEKIIQFTDKAFTILVERANGAREAIEEKCPDCDYEEVFVAAEELAKPGPPYFTAALASHPEGDLGWAFAPSDDFNAGGIQTIEQQGRKVKVAGGDGEPHVLELILKNPEIAPGTVLEPFPYESWSAMDNLARMKAGEKPWDASEMPPLIMHDPKLVEEAVDVAPEHWSPPSFDYEAMYEEIWGK